MCIHVSNDSEYFWMKSMTSWAVQAHKHAIRQYEWIRLPSMLSGEKKTYHSISKSKPLSILSKGCGLHHVAAMFFSQGWWISSWLAPLWLQVPNPGNLALAPWQWLRPMREGQQCAKGIRRCSPGIPKLSLFNQLLGQDCVNTSRKHWHWQVQVQRPGWISIDLDRLGLRPGNQS